MVKRSQVEDSFGVFMMRFPKVYFSRFATSEKKGNQIVWQEQLGEMVFSPRA